MDRRGIKRVLWLSGLFFAGIFLAGFPNSKTIAQVNGYRQVADPERFRKEFSAESAKIQTIFSDFRQEKELTALTETITSTGRFWFKRSNKVRIDYQKPFVYQMIMNGDKLLIRDEQKENRVNVKSNKLFQQVNRIMLDCIQGSILNSSDFEAKIFEDEGYYLMELVPTGKGIRDFFQSIHLKVDKKDYSVQSIEMNEPGGDRTVMIFTNKILNRAVDDEVFGL